MRGLVLTLGAALALGFAVQAEAAEAARRAGRL